ncbi:glycosyltransferase, group 1 family protein [Leptospira yanagawae serovar Saopaulo str. Sao Paulo = ATCC 700523]|uniref:Glycosyltransferase, group 1 family protein n=1 Tax=Leptospira yanagawae serovar Saopaulo str. Sao Paulo = ATCC 700523 TaxID=1249483 RepID=A0A5E8HGW6_9LEPT|nr:glycosyltransferase family 1 protein [Leptospira yanagawae]EOQ90509.1 glycosyltransferase, group 1 family protein [Leptospira yanagawae serovar Saopaulo str. Sao Paulo = ATCC 700523]
MVKTYKIGLDARPLSTRVSGVGRLIAETLKAFPNKEKYEFFLFSHLPIHSDHKKVLELSNVRWVEGGGFLKWKGGLYYNLYVPFYLLTHRLDLFWGSQQVLPPFLPKDLKAVLTYCDLVLYLYPDTMRWIAKVQQRLFQSYSVRRSSFILSISKQTSDDMCKKFGYPVEKTGVAYPGVNPEEMTKLLDTKLSSRIKDLGTGFLLSVSTIEPRKNYPFLLEVFREYRKLNPHHYRPWVIVGKIGWESPEFIEELIQERTLYKDIFILDSVSDSELQHVYKRAGLFLFASKYEGFGIPMVEALFHKLPCIVSDIPTFHEIGKDGVLYFATNANEDAKKWAMAIDSFFLDPKPVEVPVDQFRWENAAKITETAFRTVLEESE